MGSAWGSGAPGTRTAPGAGALRPGEHPQNSPRDEPGRWKSTCVGEGCSRAHLAGMQLAEQGGGTEYHTDRSQPCGNRASAKRGRF